MARSFKRSFAVVLPLMMGLHASTVYAQKGPATAGASGSAAPAPNDPASKLAEAKERYQTGLQLYERGDYDAARVEFERAYQLAPSFRILYNLGLILEQKSDYVGALKNFQTYLEEGGSQVPDVRRTQVTTEIEQLKKRVASVQVTANVPGATIYVDDVEVSHTPMPEAVLVNPGRRKISATKKGRLPAVKVIDVASVDKANVALELNEEKQVVLVDKPSRRIPWIGWGITGVFAVGAGVTGYLALTTSNELKDGRGAPDASSSHLNALSTRTKIYSAVADLSTLGALVAGGISLYYTIKWGHEYNVKLDQQQQALVIRPTPMGVAGTF